MSQLSYSTEKPKSTDCSSCAPPFSSSSELLHRIASESEAKPLAIPGQPSILFTDTSRISSFLRKEFDVSRLNEIHQHLWIVGRPGHIRPLHRQRMLRREIVITENSHMHLVWYENSLYLKPIPKALLNWEFWERVICAESAELRSSVYAFLFSYTKLILHESDYDIAVSSSLIPSVGWDRWSLFSEEVHNAAGAFNLHLQRRWEYGELRLSRLNLIYKLSLRGYSYYYVYTDYSVYFGRNFQVLLLVFAYVSVVLAGLQVVVSTKNVPDVVDRAGFIIGICALFLIAAGLGLIGSLFLGLFIYHFVATRIFRRKYFRVSKATV